MASVRAPLFNIEKINKIFEVYAGTLTSQFKGKKLVTEFINTVSSWFTSQSSIDSNPYIANPEPTKIEAMEMFKIKISKALVLDNPIPKLIEILDELNSHCELSRSAEKRNLSKYRIALRAVRCYIIRHIASHKDFKSHINALEMKLNSVNEELFEAKKSGFDPKTDTTSITKRNNLVMMLANLGHIDSIQFATEQKLFPDKDNVQPGEAFRPLTRFDREFSSPSDIIYNIPWMMQPKLDLLFADRIRRHDFPKDKETLKNILAKVNEESKSAPEISTPTSSLPADPIPASTPTPGSLIPESALAKRTDTISAESESKEVKSPPNSNAAVLAGLPSTTTKSDASPIPVPSMDAPSEQPKTTSLFKAPKHESKRNKGNKHRGATVEHSESRSLSPSSSSLIPS